MSGRDRISRGRAGPVSVLASAADRWVTQLFDLKRGPGEADGRVAKTRAHAESVGAAEVQLRISQRAETSDRRLGFMLTAGVFLAGFARIGLEDAPPDAASVLAVVGAFVAAFTVLAALRGVTRAVSGGPLHRDPTADDVEGAARALEYKLAWSWLASRGLRASVLLLLVSAVLDLVR